MKIIYNNILPVKGYVAMNLFGVIFARKAYKPLHCQTMRHESIHTAQAKDFKLRWLAFYPLYLWYYVKFGYRGNPFEREAYANETNESYLNERIKNAWRAYK